MKTYAGKEGLAGAVGSHLGCSQWHTIMQGQIDLSAQATGDHQWIHMDAERAADGPSGTTIAHGFLTLSLVPALAGPSLMSGRGRPFLAIYGCPR